MSPEQRSEIRDEVVLSDIDRAGRKPRIHYDGGDHIEIGFEGENSTLLKVGGQQGPPGWGDRDRAYAWFLTVRRALQEQERRS